MKKLSVIMACYKQEKYVAEAVESVIRVVKNIPDTEIILWDDCSPDTTFNIIKSYEKAYPELVKVFQSPENLGVAKCAAQMEEASRGEYVMIFDHDDVMLPFNVMEAIEFLDAHPEYSCSYARKFLFNEKDGFQQSSMGGVFSDFLMLLRSPMNNNALIMRRSYVLEVGNFQETDQGKESGAADIFMWLRLRMRGPVHYQDTVRLLHRVHPGQVTSQAGKLEIYKRDYRFFVNFVAQKYPDLYNAILSGATFKLNSEQAPAALWLLGGLCRHATTVEELGKYLYYARQLAPQDPAVLLEVANYYLSYGDTKQALTMLYEIFVQFDNNYYRFNTLNSLLKGYEKLQMPADSIKIALLRESAEFFHVSGEAQKIMESIRRYE